MWNTNAPPAFPNLLRIGLTSDLDLSPIEPNGDRGHLLMKDYLPTKSEGYGGKTLLSNHLHNVWETNMTFDLDLWPTDMNINRVHLPIKHFLFAINFEASVA